MGPFAVLFPGQGAQRVGMGKAMHDAYPEASTAFREADEILGYPLSSICFGGPQAVLDETRHAQPALFMCSAAVLRVLEARGGPLAGAVACAGMSLGEYTALHFAGALRFEDGLRLVAARGAAMQAACEARRGTMISVLGLTRAQVEASLAGREAWVTNVNAPDQVVVGGPVEAVDAAAEALRSAGARRVVPLQVVGAYHTSLMKPAESALADCLAGIRFSRPLVPVWSNVTGGPVPEAGGIGDLLLRQLTAPVLWSPIVEGMASSGVRRAYEIGCGNVLAGLLRRITRDVPCTVIESPADLSALAGTR